MEVYFLDSSALVKRYVQETGTAWVISVCDPMATVHLYAARITGAEVVAAIARRGRSGDLSASETRRAINQFRLEFANAYRIVDLTPAVALRAMDLAQTRVLRGYDAVQLAAALEMSSLRRAQGMSDLTLVSADGELNDAATSEGIPVENPNSHP